MPEEKPNPATRELLRLLFPGGATHFLGAVISMMPALGIAWVAAVDLILTGQDTPVTAVIIMAGVVVLAFLLAHPTFMLAKGRFWPRSFLRGLNASCLVVLALTGLIHLSGNQFQLFWFDVIGIIFGLIAFKLYRSRRFGEFCEHYRLIHELYQKSDHQQ